MNVAVTQRSRIRSAIARRDLRRRRDRRADGEPKQLSPKYFYDERGSRAVRADHRAAGILSDPHRARDPAARMRPTSRALIPDDAALDRVRQRLDRQGAHPAARGAGGRGLCAGRHLGASFSRRRRCGCAQDYPRPRGAAGRGRLHPAVRAAARIARDAAGRLLSGLDHRQFRAARGLRVPAPRRRACSAAARCSSSASISSRTPRS